MRLEEEIVFQSMKETDDKQYLLDKVKALRELGFKINPRRIRTSVRRFELLQAYDKQDNKRGNHRKVIRERFNELVASRIEALKESDPSIISGKVIKGLNYECVCGGTQISYDLKITRLQRYGKSVVKVEKILKNELPYCWKCGNSNWVDNI